MPTLYMLVGVPASGKSTWVARRKEPVVSSDDFIEAAAAKRGVTYDDVFAETVDAANKHVLAAAKRAFARGESLIWDQTNLSKKVRAERLQLAPPAYTTVAVFFPTPAPKVLAARLANRPGKTIPPDVVAHMAAALERPTLAEGFDRVQVVRKNKTRYKPARHTS